MCNNSAFISLRTIIVSIVTSAFVQHTHSAAGDGSTIVHTHRCWISLKHKHWKVEWNFWVFSNSTLTRIACTLWYLSVCICRGFFVGKAIERSRLRNLKGVSTHFCCRKDRPFNWTSKVCFPFFHYLLWMRSLFQKFHAEWKALNFPVQRDAMRCGWAKHILRQQKFQFIVAFRRVMMFVWQHSTILC